jgi:exopolyphosphatase/guanosine-5'-triphosphate,3'-diphosphate pyrophosphatase
VLNWAAQLHEVGLDIAHVKYHQHGAYLLLNGDLPGFSRHEQQLLAVLVGNHRRKIIDTDIAQLPRRMQPSALWLVLLLRIAVLLHRSRTELPVPELKLVMTRDDRVGLVFPADWLEENPLTVADLELEQSYLAAIGIGFSFRARKLKSVPA